MEKFEINETDYAVQIAKKGNSWIAVLCEVPIYPASDIKQVRAIANGLLEKVNGYESLLKENERLKEALNVAILCSNYEQAKRLYGDGEKHWTAIIDKALNSSPVKEETK